MDEWKHFTRIWHAFRVLEKRYTLMWQKGANRRTIVVICAAGLVLGTLYVRYIQPPAQFPTGEIVSISEKSTLRDAAAQLQEQHVIRSPRTLEIVVRLFGGASHVHAGDYQFKQPHTVFFVARAIIYGYYGLEPVRIRVPEHATVASMARVYARLLTRFSKDAFIEKAASQEGYLYPDTYFFLPNATEDVVISTMRENFERRVAPLLTDVAASGFTLEQIVTIASLLELEASKPEDQKMISGVIRNRLKKNMLLQIDATFTYFLGKNTYTVTQEDLKNNSPYNTYVHKGLPPGPIANPSFSSLDAAVHPTKNDYLFYLADRSGTTYYSKNYEEHLRKKSVHVD